jgi:uncharacterized membrane-anchored protein
MKNPGILAVFAVVAIVQVAVPVAMIAQRETTLRLGRPYKFRTAPVDPYDAFRGRYVWLNFEQNQARWNGTTEPTGRSRGYAIVEEGRDGFAVVREIGSQPPPSGDYVKVDRVYRGWGTNSIMANFRFPFDRYYMEETKAPAAERAYREYSNRRGETNHNTYAIVRIKGDDAVIENLYVEGQPIADFIRQAGK